MESDAESDDLAPCHMDTRSVSSTLSMATHVSNDDIAEAAENDAREMDEVVEKTLEHSLFFDKLTFAVFGFDEESTLEMTKVVAAGGVVTTNDGVINFAVVTAMVWNVTKVKPEKFVNDMWIVSSIMSETLSE